VVPTEALQPVSTLIEHLNLQHKCSVGGPMTIGCMPDDWWDGTGKLARIHSLDNGRIVLRFGTSEKYGLSAQDVPTEVAAEVRRLCDELKVGDQVLLDEHGVRLAPDLRQRVSRHAIAFPPKPLVQLEEFLRQVPKSERIWMAYCGACCEPLLVLGDECFGNFNQGNMEKLYD
jgi:hypothetical protein